MLRLLLILCCGYGTLYGQSTDTLPAANAILRVGVIDSPPYCMQDDDGNWDGMAVRLWRQVAEAGRWRYEFVGYDPRDSLLQRLLAGEIDVAAFAVLTPQGELAADYLQAYHRTSLGVALPKSTGLWSIVKGVFSVQFVYIVGGLSVLLFIVGAIVYFLERDKNGEQFGGERTFWEGIGTGFWWAGVTMTTIGYGDKAPQTFPGRMVAMLWMLVALAVTSSLTAAIIGATDARRTVQFPEDLRGIEVGAVMDSPAADFLDSRGQTYRPFASPVAGLEALENKSIGAFVHDATTLRYEVDRHSHLTANIQVTDAEPEAYAFAVRPGSPLRDPLDRAVIQVTLTEMWRGIVQQYEGTRQRRNQ